MIYEVDNSVLVQSYLDEEDIIDTSALTVKKERRLSLLPHHSQHCSAAADIQAVVDHDSHETQDIHHQHESQSIFHNNSEYDHVVDNDYDDHCDDDNCDDDHCDDDHCDDDDDDDDDHCDDDDDHCDDDDDHCDDDGFDGHSDDHRDECYENDDHGSFDPNRFQSFIAITPVEQQQQQQQHQLQTADVANHTSQKRITRLNSIVNECSKVSINANNDDNYHPHIVQHHIVSPPNNNNNNISSKVMILRMQRGRRSSINKNRSKTVTVRKSKNINGQIINLKDKRPKSLMNKKTSTKVTIVHNDDNDDNNNVDDQVNNDELFTVALHRLTTVVRNQNKVYTSLKFFIRALNKHSMLTTTLRRFETEVIPAISTILSNHKTLTKVSFMMKCD